MTNDENKLNYISNKFDIKCTNSISYGILYI